MYTDHLFDSIQDIVVATAEGVRPAERLTVAEAAEKYRYINMPGSYVGMWKNSTTPYLVEPMELLTSVSHTGMIFAGPAQCGKTDMSVNWLTHTVVCDQADMILFEKTQTTARDFSIRRIDRLHRHSPEVGKRLIPKRSADNTYDKQYMGGMIFNLSWPSINEMSGKPVPRLWLSDYDRMDQDVDGEGSPYDLAKTRATTFRSHGMCAAESSPGYIVDNPRWIKKTPHEAPPTIGILSLYNRGDRRRWYWRCVNPKCRMAFEGDFSLLQYPSSEDIEESVAMTTMRCPHCGLDYTHEGGGGMPSKHELNQNAKWIKDGMVWTPEGDVVRMAGQREIVTDTASFWLKGTAAAFVTWNELVRKFLVAEREWEDTGSETALQATVNTNQGLPYTPKTISNARGPDELKARARGYERGTVPPGVRFLVAAIDIQKHRFEVQVQGIGVGGDMWVIDRWQIQKSQRRDAEGERLWINAGAYREDWKNLVADVMLKTFPLADGSGREMGVKLTVCDSGGREGVTANAYNFVRWLRWGNTANQQEKQEADEQKEEGEYEWEPNLYQRFLLLKGEPAPTAPRQAIRFPDSQRKDRMAEARGEIPVLFLNSNSIKDTLNMLLDRKEPGGGRINFPMGLPDTFYTELTVEVKDPKTHKWENPKSYRNESWDLLYYTIGACLCDRIGLDYMNWDEPPSWADVWDKNDYVFNPKEEAKPFAAETKSDIDLSELGALLG